MKVIIYCGIPGSGKTTLAKAEHPTLPRCSTDDVFTDANGNYNYVPQLIGAARAACLRKFIELVVRNRTSVVVDNTNTSMMEVAAYANIALAYSADLEIIKLDADPLQAHARNVHGVPLDMVRAMAQRLAELDLPPWWPVRVHTVTF